MASAAFLVRRCMHSSNVPKSPLTAFFFFFKKKKAVHIFLHSCEKLRGEAWVRGYIHSALLLLPCKEVQYHHKIMLLVQIHAGMTVARTTLLLYFPCTFIAFQQVDQEISVAMMAKGT